MNAIAINMPATSSMLTAGGSPAFVCTKCDEAFTPGDAVLLQNHYWNGSVHEWREGDRFVECPECAHKMRYWGSASTKRFFRRVEQRHGL